MDDRSRQQSEPGSLSYQRPEIEVVSLSCEITAYAPDSEGSEP